jgi:GT2 family glycosyltransferase
MILPISLIIATRNRSTRLLKTLMSLSEQSALPAEVIVIDASNTLFINTVDNACVLHRLFERLFCVKAISVGAAAQRNQGVQLAQLPFVGFCDDDIDFQPDCINNLWAAIQEDSTIGGVGVTIVNQRYQPPGMLSRMLFTLLHGRHENSFAGRVIGPAVNLLPEDRDTLPAVVATEWLNTTCTLYRREALPNPPFETVFTGYSLMEDLALSLKVSQRWRLVNARTARIFHDSQPADYKSDISSLAAMELVNRHYIMTQVLGRTGIAAYCRLFVWESFQLASCILHSPRRLILCRTLFGKMKGIVEIWKSKS